MTNTPRHDLDEAIDRVAAKMVAIDDDAGLLQAAIARLPDRESRPWFLRMPVQATAAAALVVAAFLWARPSEPPATSVATAPPQSIAPPEVSAPMAVPADRRADFHLRQGYGGQARLRQGYREQARLPAPAIDRPDHEHSLAPVDPIEAIELGGIATPSIDLASPAAIEPLVLTELALDTEGDS